MGPGRSFLGRHSLRESRSQRSRRPQSSRRVCTVVGFPHVGSDANCTCRRTWPVGVIHPNAATTPNPIPSPLADSNAVPVTNGIHSVTNASPTHAHSIFNDVLALTLTHPLPRADPEQRCGA